MITRGRPTGHEPANKGKTLPGTKKPASTRTASYTVRALFDLVDAGGIAYGHIANQAGYHPVTLSRWKHGWASPSIMDVESVVSTLGYRLALIPIDV